MLSDQNRGWRKLPPEAVLMHLLVLGLSDVSLASPRGTRRSLNAPSGAGCFLTKTISPDMSSNPRLNAPSGAGCFLTPEDRGPRYRGRSCLNAPSGAGCFLVHEAL